jgi:hypothetical protein
MCPSQELKKRATEDQGEIRIRSQKITEPFTGLPAIVGMLPDPSESVPAIRRITQSGLVFIAIISLTAEQLRGVSERSMGERPDFGA